MTVSLSPTQAATLKALGTFLAGILPDGTPIFVGQTNRVPEPKATDFVVMTPTRRGRLETNVDAPADVSFTGSIAGTVLTVTDVALGAIVPGSTLFGSGVAAPTTIIQQLSGTTGGVGTYKVSPSQALSGRALAAGATNVTQATEVVVQLDVHGPNGADNAQRISTLLRDDYAVMQFATYGVDVTPLYAEDPKQLPFLNAEQQYEDRWVVEALLQTNPVVGVPQQFADSTEVDVVSVDAAYPPG